MKWRKIKGKIHLFDKTGLSEDTITTLRLLIIGVMGGTVWTNITGGIAITGYLKELGATDFLYGLVIAMSPLANAFQFLASYWMEKTGRRKPLFLVSGLIQRSIWLPFALVPFIVPMSQPQIRLWTAVICVMVSAGMAPLMNVSFFSICADVVPMRIRGRYFATRSRLATVAGLIVGLIVGKLLDMLPGFQGYCVVFIIASVFGVLDICCFFFMKLPLMKPTPQGSGLFSMMRKVIVDKRYMKTVVCMTAWMFSVQLCAPYFNVYMMNNMAMTKLEITFYGQIVSNVFLILFISRWGRALDQFGNKPVLRIATCLTSFMPFFFIPTGRGMLYMVFIANALSGATYCAVDLSAQNLFMGQASEDNKSMYFAVYFIFTQLAGSALGSAAGGWLLDNVLVHTETWNASILGVPLSRYNWLFMISWVLRLATSLFLLPIIAEPESTAVGSMIAVWRQGTIDGVKRFQVGVTRLVARRRYYKEKYPEGGK